jgi:hypothetical protein
MSTISVRAVCFAVVLFAPAFLMAQPGPGAGPGQARQGQSRGTGGVGFNGKSPGDQLAAIRGLMDASDDEWKAISPKIDKVIRAKQQMSTGAGMNWTSSNNARPVFQASTARVDTAAGRAMQDVRDAVADEKASKEDLTAKMAAVRKARQKARVDYEAAQQELVDTATPRQLAVLMTLGIVE